LTRRRRGGESRVRREEKRREKGRLVLSERDHAQLFTQRSHLVSALSSVCLSLSVCWHWKEEWEINMTTISSLQPTTRRGGRRRVNKRE